MIGPTAPGDSTISPKQVGGQRQCFWEDLRCPREKGKKSQTRKIALVLHPGASDQHITFPGIC
jgi:hypothetical protein